MSGDGTRRNVKNDYKRAGKQNKEKKEKGLDFRLAAESRALSVYSMAFVKTILSVTRVSSVSWAEEAFLRGCTGLFFFCAISAGRHGCAGQIEEDTYRAAAEDAETV